MSRLQIAGRNVCIRYATTELADRLTPATRHLTSPHHGTPDLTIDFWTEANHACFVPAGSPAGTTVVDAGSVVVSWDAMGGPLVAYDRVRRHGWIRFSRSANALRWEPAAPFSRIMHWWAFDKGLQLLHAAAVGRAAGGVLLVGRGGSGKSTTALACLAAGLDFAGDDRCLVAAGDPPVVHGLYASAKGDDRTARLLPEFKAEFAQSPLRVDGESIIFPDRVRPHGISSGFPLLGIIIPRPGGSPESRVVPSRPSAALRALAPSTLMQMPGHRAAGLQRLAAVVRRLPAWELTLGPDPATAASVIRALLDEELGA